MSRSTCQLVSQKSVQWKMVSVVFVSSMQPVERFDRGHTWRVHFTPTKQISYVVACSAVYVQCDVGN